MNHARRILLLLSLLLCVGMLIFRELVLRAGEVELPEEVFSAQGDDPNLPVCTSPVQDVCGPHEAYIGNSNFSPLFNSKPENVATNGDCCRLPSEDILTEEVQFNVLSECPPDFVVTGGSGVDCGMMCTMRCTKINTTKYMLGPERQAMFWRRPGTLRVFTGRGNARSFDWNLLPPAIRYGAGLQQWGRSGDGCIGVPFGSLLTKKTGGTCDHFFYRQLLYRDGRPVPMYRRCREMRLNPDRTRVCIPF